MADKARKAEVVRETKETSIKVSLDVDGSGKSKISTGVGFFDHMLESFAKHSAMDINAVSYTHLRAHETVLDLVCRLLLEKKKSKLTNEAPRPS